MKLVFVVAGWSVLQTGASEFALAPGCLAIVPSGVTCEDLPSTFTRTITLYLHSEFIRSHSPWLPHPHPLVHQLVAAKQGVSEVRIWELGDRGNRAILPLLQLINQLSHSQRNTFALFARIAELLDAVTLIAGQHRVKSTVTEVRDVPRRSVSEAVHALHTRLDYPWTITELAQLVALSPSQLSRQFRRDMGTSPAALLRVARADRMAEILADGDTSVVEAGRRVGWPDASMASRSFRSRYGQSPSAFAKQIRSSQMSAHRRPHDESDSDTWH